MLPYEDEIKSVEELGASRGGPKATAPTNRFAHPPVYRFLRSDAA